MSEWLILCLIFVLLSLVTIVGYVLYSGLLSEIHIRTGSPPIKNITIAYKFKQGPYKECGQLFTESCSIGPNLSSIGVFYDDPKKERKLCAHPCLEIYRDDLIHYMSPLARQGDFYVPEVRQDPDRRLLGDNDSEEDRGTDITGADSNSECSSGSGVFLSDSRETSLAPSSVPSLLQHYRGGTGGGGGEDRSDRSSRSSSFEELDMELPDGQVEEAGTELAIDAPCNKHLETTTEERGVIAGGEE
uniref:Testis expressed 264, ER-phagy receptor n=1 Tax=Hucho hucho TaxID=62062 RepID=A0A4W5QQU2_9TELE